MPISFTSSWSNPDHQQRSQILGMWNERRYCWVFLLQRSQRCDERQTNKGAERGHGVPIEWRNPTWVEVSRGQTFSGRCWWSFQWLPKDYMVKWVIRRLGLKPSVLCFHGSACMCSSECFCSRQQGSSATRFFLCVQYHSALLVGRPQFADIFTSRYDRGNNLTQGYTISNLFEDWMDYWSDNPRPIKLSPDSFSLIHREQSKVCAMSDQAEIEVYTGMSSAKICPGNKVYETTCWQFLILMSTYDWKCTFLN